MAATAFASPGKSPSGCICNVLMPILVPCDEFHFAGTEVAIVAAGALVSPSKTMPSGHAWHLKCTSPAEPSLELSRVGPTWEYHTSD